MRRGYSRWRAACSDPAARIRFHFHSGSRATGSAAALRKNLPPIAALLLAIGAGAMFFCHVNGAGFWVVRESFGLNLKPAVMAWAVLRTIVSVVCLALFVLWRVLVSGQHVFPQRPHVIRSRAICLFVRWGPVRATRREECARRREQVARGFKRWAMSATHEWRAIPNRCD